jgi:flagellar motor switch/type III secretory pathway protein FliN
MLLYRFWSSFCMSALCMATVHPLPAPTTAKPGEPEATEGKESTGESALMSLPSQPVEGDLPADPPALSGPMARLPVELDVSVPVRDFRVRNLLVLEAGQLIESQWANGADVPLVSGDVRLAWSEFEVVDTQLAVRVTRLL